MPLMRPMRIVVVAALAAALATIASAQESTPAPAPDAVPSPVASPVPPPAPVAPAQPREHRPFGYLQLRGGAYMPGTSDLEAFDKGLAADASFGYRFSPYVAMEFGVGYFQTSASASAQGMNAELTFSDIPVTATLKLVAPLAALELYAVAGAGLHSVTLDASLTGVGSASESATVFGFHVGGGLLLPVSSTVSLGLDVRHLVVRPSFNDVEIKIDGTTVTGALVFRL